MAPPSLVSMSQRTCIRNITGLQDVGDIAYDLVRTILKKIDNPQQLREIEIASPHIADTDAELWKAFIMRDISQWEEKIVEPKNPRSWWKVYRKLIKEERRAKEAQEEQLKASLIGIDKEKEANQATFVQRVIPQQQSRGKAFVDGVRNPHTNSWGQNRTPALQNAKRGKDILSAIRKQSSNAHQQKGFSQIQPAKALVPGAKSQIRSAPMGMVRDHAKPTSAAAARQAHGVEAERRPAPVVFVPRSGQSVQDKALNSALRAEQAKKEDRLRALASGGQRPPTASSPAPAPRRASTSAQSPPSVAADQRSPTAALSLPTATDALSSEKPRAELAVAAETRRRLSPSPVPQRVVKRPAAASSIFMPSKKKR